MRLQEQTFRQTGSGKSKMAASELKMRVSLIVHHNGNALPSAIPMFSGVQLSDETIGNIVRSHVCYKRQ